MALSKQLIGFNFSNGLSTEADATMSAPGTLEKAENVRYLESGALVGREGFVNLGSRETLAGGSIDTGYVNAKRQNEYLVADGDNLYSRPSLTGVTDELSDCGVYKPNEFSNKFVRMPKSKKHSNAHYALANGVEVFVYADYDAANIVGSNVYRVVVDVRDEETGHFYVSNYELATLTRVVDKDKDQRLYEHPQPQCIVAGAYIYIFYFDGQFVRFSTVNTTPISTGGAVSLTNLTPNAGTKLPRNGSGDFVEPSDDDSSIATQFHPVFSVAAVNNASISNGFAVAYSVDEDTGRLVTFTQSSGTPTASASIDFTPKQDGSSSNTKFLFAPLDGTPKFGITSGMQLVALNDNTSSATSVQYFVFYTKQTDSAATTPAVTFNAFAANLSATEIPDSGSSGQDTILAGRYLVTASAKTASDDGTVYVALETVLPSKLKPNPTKTTDGGDNVFDTINPAPTADTTSINDVLPYYATHDVRTGSYIRGDTDSYAGLNLATFAGSLTSDIFRYDGKLYYAVSHYSAPFEGNFTVQGKSTTGLQGTNNVLVIYQLQTSVTDTLQDIVISATPTGAAASSFISDYIHRIQQDTGDLSSGFRSVYGIQRVTEVSTGKFRFGANRFVEFAPAKAITYYTDTVRGASLCEIDFNTTKLPQYVENQNTTVFTGGFNTVYDGAQVFENEAFTAPVILNAGVETASTGVGILAAGTYRYLLVNEFVDAQGNVYRSAPSKEVEVTLSSTDVSNNHKSITLTIGPWAPSRRNLTSRIAVYRNVPGATAPEARNTFRRLATIAYDADRAVNIFNDSGQMEDEIETGDILYTSGFQPNGNIGSTKDITLHRNRIFAVSAEDIIFASQPLEIETALRFVTASSNYIIPITNEKANIAAIGSNLEHLIVFTTRNGYAIAGDGPDATGNGLFSRPRKFAPEIGAREDAAAKLTPMGFMVQTGSGIVSVDKTLQVTSIGAPITKMLQTQEKGLHRDETVIYTHLKSIAVNPKVKEIYLGFENMDNISDPGTNGVDDEFICVFNYGVRQWTTFKLRLAEGASNQGLVVINGDLFRLDSNGHSSKMQSTQYVTGTATNTTGVYTDTHDASTRAFTKVIKTNFIKFGGPQEQFRLYRIGILGDYTAASTIAVTLYKDYRTTGDALTSTEITSDANPYHLRAHVDDQKCQAVSVEITITNSATSTDDLELSSLVFEVGKRSSRLKLPATQTLVNS